MPLDHHNHLACQLDDDPAFARPPNPDLDRTLISVRISKEDAAYLDAEVFNRKHFGLEASRTALISELVAEWRRKQAHKRTLQESLLRGNEQDADSEPAQLRAVGGAS
jgi:hypothetical protein